jgi:plastocyanin
LRLLSGIMMFAGRLIAKGVPVLLALLSFSATAQTTAEVRIEGYKFLPPEVTIRSGDFVRWVNGEKRTSHSVLFPAEGGIESERLFPDESWQRHFTKPGRYEYTCGPHPEMKGVVIVVD